MISRENATISICLACLALITILAGQWVTRPADMDLLGSVVAAVVIYIIVAGAPQVLLFAAAVCCTKRGYIPPSGWWAVAYLVFGMQVAAGATFIAGGILRDERWIPLAAAVLILAALLAVASGLAASRVAYREGGATGHA